MRKLPSIICALGTLLITGQIQVVAEDASAQSSGLRFADHDHQRAVAALAAANQALSTATVNLQTVEKTIADATAAKLAAEKRLTDASTAVTAAEAAKPIAEKAALEAATASQKVKDDATADQASKDKAALDATNAQNAANAAAELLKNKLQERAAAETEKANADKAIEQAKTALKPAQEAKATAEKQVALITPTLKMTDERLQGLSKNGAIAKPEQTHLLQSLTHNRPFLSCRFDPTGEFVFGGSQDNSIQRWDLVLGQKTPFTAHKSWVSDFDFQPGSNLLISAAYEGKLQWWEGAPALPSAIRQVAAHKGQVRSISFSNDGQFVATGGNDKIVRLWRASDGALLKELVGHTSHVYNVAFHPNGKQLVTGELLGVIKQWDVETWQWVRDFDASPLSKYDPTFRADCGGIRATAFSPDGRIMAVGGIGEVTNAFAGVGKPTVLVFDWVTGQRIHLLNPKGGFQGSVWGLHFHPSGEFLIGAGGGGSGGMWFWNVDTGTALLDMPLPSPAYDLSIHPDGLRLAVACYDNSVKIYDMGPKFEPAKK